MEQCWRCREEERVNSLTPPTKPGLVYSVLRLYAGKSPLFGAVSCVPSRASQTHHNRKPNQVRDIVYNVAGPSVLALISSWGILVKRAKRACAPDPNLATCDLGREEVHTATRWLVHCIPQVCDDAVQL